MEEIRVADVEVGERRRQELGDLAGLAASIRRYGLLHPLVVDEDNHLIAGGRRLAAVELLRWERVPVRRFAGLTEDEKREIELEENLRRKDLTPFEQSRTLVQLVETKREIAKTCSKLEQVSKPARGPSREPGSLRDICRDVEASPSEIVRSEQHVETAEAYPFMQHPAWKQYHVLEAKTHLEKIPDEHRQVMATMVAEDGIPPPDAIKMIANVAAMPEADRQRVTTAYRSEDRRDRDWAKTRAADRVPYIDEREVVLGRMLRDANDCEKMYPNDAFNPRFAALAEELKGLRAEIKSAQQERNDANAR